MRTRGLKTCWSHQATWIKCFIYLRQHQQAYLFLNKEENTSLLFCISCFSLDRKQTRPCAHLRVDVHTTVASSCKCSWLLWQQCDTSRLQTANPPAEMTPTLTSTLSLVHYVFQPQILLLLPLLCYTPVFMSSSLLRCLLRMFPPLCSPSAAAWRAAPADLPSRC